MQVNKNGQSLTEFVLVMPFVFLLIFVVVEFALTGIRSYVATFAAMQSSQSQAKFQNDVAEDVLQAILPRVFFKGGAIDESRSNTKKLAIRAITRPLINLNVLKSALTLKREVPVEPVLIKGLSNEVLQGGDTPSPYCTGTEGYNVCGYPE